VTGAFVHSVALMDTVVTFRVPLRGVSASDCHATVQRGVEWFKEIERCCSRFDPTSEVSALTARAGGPVEVSAILFEAVQFALALAEESGGAFDPTVGHAMEARGFNVEYRSGNAVRSAVATDEPVSFRDVRCDSDGRTITLQRPLVLDLAAVVKGLAIDLAARELRPFKDFLIDAGGDVYASGCNEQGLPWAVGIRHPRDASALIDTVHVSNAAVCTSGDYERHGDEGAAHIIDQRVSTSTSTSTSASKSASKSASATVIAPTAMVADGLSTAAFVLGPRDGVSLLERHAVRGFIVTPDLRRFATRDA
jgi:thiamine biosynthesis lipoprotein